MLPYKTYIQERRFESLGLSEAMMSTQINDWLLDLVDQFHFNRCNYNIYAGRWVIKYVLGIINDPMRRLHTILDPKYVYMLGDEFEDSIKIEWREPVYKEDGVSIRGFYIDDIFRGITCLPTIKKVIYNNPATIIFWADDTKTVVQCQEGDTYDPEKGLALAIAKKALGNTSRKLNDVLHKWEKKKEPSVPRGCSNCKYNSQKLSKEPCKSCDSSFWSNWEAEK